MYNAYCVYPANYGIYQIPNIKLLIWRCEIEKYMSSIKLQSWFVKSVQSHRAGSSNRGYFLLETSLRGTCTNNKNKVI